MARTTRATTKAKQRKREAATDRKAVLSSLGDTVSRGRGPEDLGSDRDDSGDDSGETEETTTKIRSGLILKRPGMDDLSLDELSACPTPEDALALLSPDAAEAMQAVPAEQRLEVCKTIVALGDVIARTHRPTLASIKLVLGTGNVIRTTIEANGSQFYLRDDSSVVAAVAGAIVALARTESKQRKGSAHIASLERWGSTFVEAGQYLLELSSAARGIADELVQESGKQLMCRRMSSPEGTDSFMCMRPENHQGQCAKNITPDNTPPGYQRVTVPVQVPPRGEGPRLRGPFRPGRSADGVIRSQGGRGGRAIPPEDAFSPFALNQAREMMAMLPENHDARNELEHAIENLSGDGALQHAMNLARIALPSTIT